MEATPQGRSLPYTLKVFAVLNLSRDSQANDAFRTNILSRLTSKSINGPGILQPPNLSVKIQQPAYQSTFAFDLFSHTTSSKIRSLSSLFSLLGLFTSRILHCDGLEVVSRPRLTKRMARLANLMIVRMSIRRLACRGVWTSVLTSLAMSCMFLHTDRQGLGRLTPRRTSKVSPSYHTHYICVVTHPHYICVVTHPHSPI